MLHFFLLLIVLAVVAGICAMGGLVVMLAYIGSSNKNERLLFSDAETGAPQIANSTYSKSSGMAGHTLVRKNKPAL